MKSVAVAAALILLVAAGPVSAGAQQRRHRPAPAPPPAPFVPQTLSTGGITTLPPPPRPGPFDARPRTYAPRYNNARPRYGGGGDIGFPYYDSSVGIGEYIPPPPAVVAPPVEPAVAPAPEATRTPAPAPEPPRVAVAHGPDTFYLIPGCYAGNNPPKIERLPKGCDATKLRTLPVR